MSRRQSPISRFARIISFVFGLMVLVVNLGKIFSWSEDYPEPIPYDYSNPDCHEGQADSEYGRNTTRSWRNLFPAQDYCMDYKTDDAIYSDSRYFRQYLTVDDVYSQNDFWRDVYEKIARRDAPELVALADTLYAIGQRNELDRNEFANLVVSFVQDIPYSFILPEATCKDEDPSIPCVESERFGILSPVEFIHTLKGDCDTRTLLLYCLFKHFGYSPIIVNSWTYLHSMLLLDVVSPGEYIEHRGIRHYFWETTYVGWKSGEIPPDMGDLSNWHIILD